MTVIEQNTRKEQKQHMKSMLGGGVKIGVALLPTMLLLELFEKELLKNKNAAFADRINQWRIMSHMTARWMLFGIASHITAQGIKKWC